MTIAEDAAREDAGAQGTFPPGKQFGNYTIVRLLGEGGMGAVYEATHVGLGKRVALKTLLPQIARDAGVRARFLQEGKAASQIRHPNVVDVTDVGVEGEVPYLVMEFLDGESLARRIERGGRLGAREVADMMLPVIAALSAIHAEGIVHRDLKPDNVFLARTRDGMVVPKVLDFGISKVEDAGRPKALTATSALLGTPHYMSPEQAQGSRGVGPHSDQYALGVILYEALTGRVPFDGDTLYAVLNAIVTGVAPPPASLEPSVPPALEAAVIRAMQRDPGARFPAVSALGRELLPFASEEVAAVWRRVFGENPPAALLRGTPAADTIAAPGVAPRVTPASQPSPAPVASTLQPGLVSAPPAPPRRPPGPMAALAVVAALVAIGFVAARSLRGTPPVAPAAAALAAPPPSLVAQRQYEVRVQATPDNASLEVDGVPAGVGALVRSFALDGATHTLRVTAAGHEAQALTFRDAPPPERVALVAFAPVAPTAPPRTTAPRVPPRVAPTHAPVRRPPATGVAAPPTGVNGSPLVD
ncbi:MAG: protein kinase [Polyangiales bacterium]